MLKNICNFIALDNICLTNKKKLMTQISTISDNWRPFKNDKTCFYFHF